MMHGYDSVVGPVKGVYDKDSSTNKAREHNLLVSDRPPFVTILTLGLLITLLVSLIDGNISLCVCLLVRVLVLYI